MRLEDLKDALQVTIGINVNKVIFDPLQELNIERDRDYPMIMWDFNTLKFTTKSGRRTETTYTVKCYILEFIDTASKVNIEDKHELWQQMHVDILEYIAKVNEDTKHEIHNELDGEFFTEGGTSVESEIAIGYDITIRQTCE